MGKLKNLINFFPYFFKQNDTYKVEGRGILERFLEIFGTYFEDTISADIKSTLDIIDIEKTPSYYINYIWEFLGELPFVRSGLIDKDKWDLYYNGFDPEQGKTEDGSYIWDIENQGSIILDEETTRKVLRYAIPLIKNRGTKKFFEVILRMYGLIVTIDDPYGIIDPDRGDTVQPFADSNQTDTAEGIPQVDSLVLDSEEGKVDQYSYYKTCIPLSIDISATQEFYGKDKHLAKEGFMWRFTTPNIKNPQPGDCIIINKDGRHIRGRNSGEIDVIFSTNPLDTAQLYFRIIPTETEGLFKFEHIQEGSESNWVLCAQGYGKVNRPDNSLSLVTEDIPEDAEQYGYPCRWRIYDIEDYNLENPISSISDIRSDKYYYIISDRKKFDGSTTNKPKAISSLQEDYPVDWGNLYVYWGDIDISLVVQPFADKYGVILAGKVLENLKVINDGIEYHETYVITTPAFRAFKSVIENFFDKYLPYYIKPSFTYNGIEVKPGVNIEILEDPNPYVDDGNVDITGQLNPVEWPIGFILDGHPCSFTINITPVDPEEKIDLGYQISSDQVNWSEVKYDKTLVMYGEGIFYVRSVENPNTIATFQTYIRRKLVNPYFKLLNHPSPRRAYVGYDQPELILQFKAYKAITYLDSNGRPVTRQTGHGRQPIIVYKGLTINQHLKSTYSYGYLEEDRVIVNTSANPKETILNLYLDKPGDYKWSLLDKDLITLDNSIEIQVREEHNFTFYYSNSEGGELFPIPNPWNIIAYPNTDGTNRTQHHYLYVKDSADPNNIINEGLNILYQTKSGQGEVIDEAELLQGSRIQETYPHDYDHIELTCLQANRYPYKPTVDSIRINVIMSENQ